MNASLDCVKAYGRQWFEQQFDHAYLLLDEAGTVLASEGRFDKLGLPAAEIGRPVNELYLFTEGLLPLDTPSIHLPMVKVNRDRSLDIYLFHVAEGIGLFVVDVTEKDRMVAGLQQRLNTAALAQERERRRETHGDRFDTALFKALDIAVFRHEGNGRLEIVGTRRPGWLDDFAILGNGGADPSNDATHSFIGLFLIEARAFWEKQRAGRIASGIWVETDERGEEHLLEAVALKADGEEMLVIAHNLGPFGEKQTLIQKGRELVMGQDMLKRMHADLLAARDNLEEVVYKRTRQLQEANARLSEELELRKSLESDRHNILIQLQQAQKMEAIGTLAGGIAHDFNNILSAILGYAELSVMEAEGNDRLHGNLEQVLSAAQRARELTRQILVFSRQSKPERKPVHLAAVVDETLALMRASLPAGIRIEQDIDTNAFVMADPTQMHQVVMNLCTNAMQAILPDDGTLSVGLHERWLKADALPPQSNVKPGHYIELCVRDSGCGMSPEVVRRIFDPFYTTKEKGKGTGMGLSVVHGIVTESSGAVDVQSRPGIGTIFTVLLPVVSERPADRRGSKGPPATGTERVLFIDDEAMQVNLARQALGRLGYRVFATTDCHEALQKFADDPRQFDLIISDINMPQMDGRLLCTKVKQIRKDMPIIVCSGYSENLNAAVLQEIGVDHYLMKPVGNWEMAAAIRRLLDR